MTGTRVGVAVILVGAVMILVGTFDVRGDDLIHTMATCLVVLGAVILSVATEGQDETVS